MSRLRMSWDWVGEYPIFIYTRWLEPFRFKVKIVKGEKLNQNAPGYGPAAPAWQEYITEDLQSKDEVVTDALRITRKLLKEKQNGLTKFK